MIEKLLVSGRKGGPILEMEFPKGLFVVLARSSQTRLTFLDALASMGVAGIEDRLQHSEKYGRICVTAVDDGQKRIMLVREFSKEAPIMRGVDLDTGRETEVSLPIAEAMLTSERDLAHGDGGKGERGIWKVPSRLLVGKQGKRLEEAISLLDDVMGHSEEDANYHKLKKEVERITELRERRADLRSRIAWLVERISFLDSRISAVDAALQTKAECDEIEEYVGLLKEEFESWRVRFADALAAKEAVEKARARLSEYSGMEGAFDPEMAGEIRNLILEMSELEKKAIVSEGQQSKILSEITRLRSEMTLVCRNLNELEATGFSRRILEKAESSVKGIEERETIIADLSDRISEVDTALGRKKLADALSIGGALLTIVSLIGVLVPGNVFPSMRASESLMGLLILLLSVGLMTTVYGVSSGIELDAKHGARKRLDQERANLSNQVAWHRRRLGSLLGGFSLNEYNLSVEQMEWLIDRKTSLSEEIRAFTDELSRSRNEGDLTRMRTARAQERMAELMKMSGFSSPLEYLEAYESYRKVEARYREATDRMESALGGRSEASLAQDIEIILEEIAVAESRRAAIADPRVDGRVRELSDEYAIKADERELLALELEQMTLELIDVEHALADVDMWEASSAAAEAAYELEHRKVEGSAAGLARVAIRGMFEERRAQAGRRLAELASDIMSFLTGKPGTQISCDVQEECVKCSLPSFADSDSLIPLSALAVRLGASEIVLGKGTLPLIVDYSSQANSGRIASKGARKALSLLLPALEKLARTRQVILILEGSGFADVIPASYEVATV